MSSIARRRPALWAGVVLACGTALAAEAAGQNERKWAPRPPTSAPGAEDRYARVALPSKYLDAEVQVWSPDGTERLEVDARGFLRVPPELEGRTVLLHVEGAAPCYRKLRAEGELMVGRFVPWNLHLQDLDGKPVAGATVRTLSRLEGYELPPALMARAAGVMPGEWTTDENGDVRLPTVHGLGLEIEVDGQPIPILPTNMATGNGGIYFDEFNTLQSTGPRKQVETTWVYWPKVRTALHFEGDRAQPLAGLTCRVLGVNGIHHPVRTDEEGWAVLEQAAFLPPERFPFLVLGPSRPSYLELGDGRTWVVQTTVGGTNSNLGFVMPRELSYRPDRLKGRKLEVATFPARLTSHAYYVADAPDDEGLWLPVESPSTSLDRGLQGGRALMVKVRDAETKEGIESFLYTRSTGMDIVSSPQTGVLVRVHGLEDPSLEGLKVWMNGRSQPLSAEGTVEIIANPGEASVELRFGRNTLLAKNLHVYGNGAGVDLDASSCEMLRSKVLLPDGEAAEGARAAIWDPSAERVVVAASCDSEGDFALPYVPAPGLELIIFDAPLGRLGISDGDGMWVAGKVADFDDAASISIPLGRITFADGVRPTVDSWPSVAFLPAGLPEGVRPVASMMPMGTEGKSSYPVFPGTYAIRTDQPGDCRYVEVLPGQESVIRRRDSEPSNPPLGSLTLAIDGYLTQPTIGTVFFEPVDGGPRVHLASVMAFSRSGRKVQIPRPDGQGALIFEPWFDGPSGRIAFPPPEAAGELTLSAHTVDLPSGTTNLYYGGRK